MLLFSSFFSGAVGVVRWELTGFGEGGDSTCDDGPLAAGGFKGPRNQDDRFKDESKCTQTNFSSLSHDSKYQTAISDISLLVHKWMRGAPLLKASELTSGG